MEGGSPSVIVDGYVCVQRIGGGASSTVYKAYPKASPNKVVAIKVIDRLALLLVNKHAEKYLQREITILKQLDHPNIVKLVEVQDDGMSISLVTEYCAGGPLSDYLRKKGKLSEHETLDMLSQLADALKYMYNKSVIHRDLKPQNILLGENGKIKICDYGFARIHQRQKLMESVLGSPLYMAPEILNSDKYTSKCDLWSLGIIMYEMLAGAVPFNTNSVAQLYMSYKQIKNNNSVIMLPPNVDDVVSANCRALLGGLLKVVPEERITWPDFFQHPFFYSTPAVPPPSPVSSLIATKPTNDSVISVVAVPECDKVEVDIKNLDSSCLVKLFKLSLATKLQLGVSSLANSTPPMLMLCTANSVTELEDDKPLSAYRDAFSKQHKDSVRLMLVNVAQKQDYTGEILQDVNNNEDSKEATPVGPEDLNNDVAALARLFKVFVARQEEYLSSSRKKYEQCAKYTADRDIQLSAAKKASSMLASSLKMLNGLSGSLADLFLQQEGAIQKISRALPGHLQDFKTVLLHDTVRAPGRTTLLDLVEDKDRLKLLEEATSEQEICRASLKKIQNASDRAEQYTQSPSCEDIVTQLRSAQREAQQWIEGLRLYREHTVKWESIVSQYHREREKEPNDVQDLEWSFVIDGLLEVRAGCEHDLKVARKLATCVTTHWQKCYDTRASVWESLRGHLQHAVKTKEEVITSLQELPLLGQRLLDQQARVERLTAVMELPDLYHAYVHNLHSQYVFENRTGRLLEVFNQLRSVQQEKLIHLQQKINRSPLSVIFSGAAANLDPANLTQLHVTGSLSKHDDAEELAKQFDDDFDVMVIEEDTKALLHENAALSSEVRTLREAQQQQQVIQPVAQLLGLITENEKLNSDLANAKEIVAQQAHNLEELQDQYNELARTMRGREGEQSREREEASSKMMQMMEVLRRQNKEEREMHDEKVRMLLQELAESKKEIAALKGEAHDNHAALMSLQSALDESENSIKEKDQRIAIFLTILGQQNEQLNLQQQQQPQPQPQPQSQSQPLPPQLPQPLSQQLYPPFSPYQQLHPHHQQ